MLVVVCEAGLFRGATPTKCNVIFYAIVNVQLVAWPDILKKLNKAWSQVNINLRQLFSEVNINLRQTVV